MEIKNAVAGTLESGDIMIQIAPGDGLQVELQSSVAAQFGRQIKALITETLSGLGIDNAYVKATDKGALDCTIRARVTAAAVRATACNCGRCPRNRKGRMERLRRTMMFVPGNNPGMMADAHIYGPDSIMLDLEDSVTMAEKDAARLLDFGGTEMVVRINPLSTPYGRKDVEAVVKAGVDVIRMPKTETADEVRELEAEIIKVETELGCVGRTLIMAAIESALGVVNAYEIATASKRMMGIALGAEDYSANLKTQRTPEGSELLLARETIVVAARAAGISCFDTVSELLLARETIVVAARAAGISCFDTVYSNLDDMDTFRKEVELIKNLGFDGKSIINPRQIEVVNEVFAPTQKAIDKALRIIAAIKEAQAKGSGVIAVNGKMVDRPVVIRAERTIALAIASGILSKEEAL